ncbi:tRNA uridine-5-carboxymethylaminomethyl(34) synthesis GTPase MnmE [Sphingomonas swuensis]|uniref:tRNA modification GTPase MnmE n=1 Tax=Sphingomonas swuensis TaxID=977800 RepID=A0ABP7S8Y1_9SPHN
MTDTIFALSSGALPAAIAVVRVSGPNAFLACERIAGMVPKSRQATLRTLHDEEEQAVDRALVLAFAAPATVTGEPLVEFHCHGGRAVVSRLLSLLSQQPGLRDAEPGEFTRRALLNGKLDLTQAEGLGELLAAETEWQRRAALESAGGALSREIEGWRERLLLLAAQAEAAIDYVDEEETALDLTDLVQQAEELRGEWRRRIDAPRSELLSEGLRIVLAGPPNSGKSSLFNALIGAEKAIVTAIPGTTRDLIEARWDLSGIPTLLIDTAGLREGTDEVERIGIARAEAASMGADILLWLGAVQDAPAHPRTILVSSKSDLREGTDLSNGLRVSAKTGDGLDELKAQICTLANELLPPPNQAALNRRQSEHLLDAACALEDIRNADSILIAEALRSALHSLDRLTGRQSVEDVLDALFGRFCLGK